MTKIKAIIKKSSCLKLVFSKGIESKTLKKGIAQKFTMRVIIEPERHLDVVSFNFLR